MPFLVITFLVYACIPELKNLHGKTLMSYVFSLTLSFILLAVINSRSVSNEEQFTIGLICKVIGYLFYMFILTSFFWLNIMSYDIWRTITGAIRDKRKEAELKRYFNYAKYAFGLPLLILLFAFIMDHVEGIPRNLRPDIGDDTCFLSSNLSSPQILYKILTEIFP